jgi:ubiquinone/menaquinone biosynthesis C-methylase UbiE
MQTFGYKILRRNRFYETGERLVQELRVQNFNKILDLGCGENLYKDLNNIVGIDLVSAEADVIADIRNLPYEDNSIDCVLVFGSLLSKDVKDRIDEEPLTILNSQLIEICRVLKPEGILYGRTSYLDILNDTSLLIYEETYGFERLESKYILNKNLENKRLFWKWKKI